MRTKPPDVQYEPLLCPFCLHQGIVRRTWVDAFAAALICSSHGAVFAIEDS